MSDEFDIRKQWVGPVTTTHILSDLAPNLRRPFAPNSMRFKVQATWPKDNPRNGLIVPYVDARTVSQRLNHVAEGDWRTEFAAWGTDMNLAVCHLTVCGVTRSDIGKGQGLEKEKAAFSDALKRAAVHFGIGTFIYTLRAVTLGTAQEDDKPVLKSKGKSLVLTPQAETWLREKYAGWANSDANNFGEILDHGDELGALGDPVEREPVEQEDLELAAEREKIQKVYEERIVKANGKRSKFPKGRFNAQLKAADSPEKLKELREKIEEAAA